MIKEVKITKGHDHYFYETEEKLKKCPKCDREYRTRKFCLHCSKKFKVKVLTEDCVKWHVGMVTKDLKKYSCDCIFSSWFRFGKYWPDNYPNTRCKHCKWAMRKIKVKK